MRLSKQDVKAARLETHQSYPNVFLAWMNEIIVLSL